MGGFCSQVYAQNEPVFSTMVDKHNSEQCSFFVFTIFGVLFRLSFGSIASGLPTSFCAATCDFLDVHNDGNELQNGGVGFSPYQCSGKSLIIWYTQAWMKTFLTYAWRAQVSSVGGLLVNKAYGNVYYHM